jgi:hypothetical protein
MQLKPVKYGMKTYALCKAKSGYACSLNLYNNKIKDGNVEMIKKLTSDLKFPKHHIYMDNFYTGTKVFQSLREQGFYICGKIRENRENRGGPKGFKVLIKKLKKDEGYLINNEKTVCLGFKDNGNIWMISNIHSRIFEYEMISEPGGNGEVTDNIKKMKTLWIIITLWEPRSSWPND